MKDYKFSLGVQVEQIGDQCQVRLESAAGSAVNQPWSIAETRCYPNFGAPTITPEVLAELALRAACPALTLVVVEVAKAFCSAYGLSDNRTDKQVEAAAGLIDNLWTARTSGGLPHENETRRAALERLACRWATSAALAGVEVESAIAEALEVLGVAAPNLCSEADEFAACFRRAFDATREGFALAHGRPSEDQL